MEEEIHNENNMMKEQVLSIEQMQELEELGIDTSNASMFWYIDNRFKQIIPCSDRDTIKDWTNQHGENCIIPTFTLQDILEMLPKPCYINCIDEDFYQCEVTTKYGSLSSNDKNPLVAAFNILMHCKQNNFI